MADVIEPLDVEGARRDLADTKAAVNEKRVIVPRSGLPFKSYPLVVEEAELKADEVVAKGFYLGFANEAAMRAYTPSFAETRAKLDDTKKVYRWQRTSGEGVTPIVGIWHDTGLSELDQAKADAAVKDTVVLESAEKYADETAITAADELKKTMMSEKSDVNAAYMFEEAAGDIIVIIKKDGNIITPKCDLHSMKTILDFLNMFKESIDKAENKIDSSVDDDDLYKFDDADDITRIRFTKNGNIKLSTNAATLARTVISSGEEARKVYAKEMATDEYLHLNMQRLLLSNVSTLSPFVGSFKQKFSIKNSADFLDLKIKQAERLVIDTPYFLKNSGGASDQVVHPYVCSFLKTVNGYKHIIALTPFHHTNDMYENPCIYGSNDLKKFTLLDDFKQPLVGLQPTGFYNYNSDPSCMFDHRTGEFCVLNRNTQIINGANVSNFSLLKTKDFMEWSEPQAFSMEVDALSPTAIFDTTLNMWVMFSRGDGGTLSRRTAASLEDTFTIANTINAPFNLWHGEVKFCGSHYVGVFGDNMAASGGALYLGISADGITWQFSTDIFNGSHLPAYKPSITHEFVDDTHIKFNIVWTSSDISGVTSEKWNLFSAETTAIEVI